MLLFNQMDVCVCPIVFMKGVPTSKKFDNLGATQWPSTLWQWHGT